MRLQRLSKIGIQRELRVAWFDFAHRLHLSGCAKVEAREQIYDFLDGAPGFESPPTAQSKKYIANVLIKSWINPDCDLVDLRDDAASLLQSQPALGMPLHWIMVGAAYPFWFSVSTVVGRLLSLQSQVTQKQIVTRLKEDYGDRQTISRRARYVIRSYVAWGVLEDADGTGNYRNGARTVINDISLIGLMFESVLQNRLDGRQALSLLLRSPALFPYQLPAVSGNMISSSNNRIEVSRFATDDEILRLDEATRHRKLV